MGDSDRFSDPLVRQRLFPEPEQIFKFSPVELGVALKEGIIAVDTNVLLLPYTTGKASLEQIRITYASLVEQHRLRIPGQVAREFAEHRAEKLKNLYQQLSKKQSFSFPRSKYPLLEGIAEYDDLVAKENKVDSLLDEYRETVGKIRQLVAKWHWNDPVSEIYRTLFTDEVVIDPPLDRDKILKDLKYRQEHRIPPGYKDAANEYSGVGDFLIWNTLLHIGREMKQHLVFVSGDEKSDWRYQSEGHALYPRIELLEEYRVASQGKSFLIVSFAKLLDQFGVADRVVAEVRRGEVVSGGRPESWVAQSAVRDWLAMQYGGVDAGDTVDFVVKTADGPLAFEVKLIKSIERVLLSLRQLDRRLSSAKMVPMRLNVVLVATQGFPTARLRSIAGRIRRTTFALIDEVILGRLTDDGNFESVIASGIRDRSTITVHRALWGTGTTADSYVDVTDLVRGYVSSGSPFYAANEYFGDAFPNELKHLRIEYSRGGGPRMIAFPEGRAVHLPPT